MSITLLLVYFQVSCPNFLLRCSSWVFYLNLMQTFNSFAPGTISVFSSVKNRLNSYLYISVFIVLWHLIMKCAYKQPLEEHMFFSFLFCLWTAKKKVPQAATQMHPGKMRRADVSSQPWRLSICRGIKNMGDMGRNIFLPSFPMSKIFIPNEALEICNTGAF